ncbi:MAG: FAD-binding oxidoreductase, partial [Clostridiales bacterium]|nr:FAD-binding oxidoreductase [Clostridiales bacterium]
MNSVWHENASMPSFPKLEGDIKTEVLIIGGGISGILCAYFLQQEGVKYVLVESGKICSGATKNTTAKITAQHGLVYDKLIKGVGLKKAGLYLKANLLALEKYKSLCKDIDCDFEQKDSYVYSLDNRDKIKGEVEALKNLGISAKFIDKVNLPFKIEGAV